MSEKSDQEQDPKLDQNPEAVSEESLVDVDQLLAEEDPEFLNQLKSIEINPEHVDRAGVGAALTIENRISQNIFYYFKQAVDYQNNLKHVLIFWVSSLLLLAALLLIWFNKPGFLNKSLFITSHGVLGTEPQLYNPLSESEAFYDNPRFAKNLVTMNSVFVNLRPSENSGDNPMLIFEITVEGLSADAIVEIKDRQVEFKDMIARLAEEKTYDFVTTAEGKRQLCDEIRDLLNANLTRGQVRRVMIKNFISNPD